VSRAMNYESQAQEPPSNQQVRLILDRLTGVSKEIDVHASDLRNLADRLLGPPPPAPVQGKDAAEPVGEVAQINLMIDTMSRQLEHLAHTKARLLDL
jgi:hypothetical protein